MAIKHTILQGDRGHSLTFTSGGEYCEGLPPVPVSTRVLAVVDTNEYFDFGLAKTDVPVKVVSGFLRHNGSMYRSGQEIVVKEGGRICFVALTVVVILFDN